MRFRQPFVDGCGVIPKRAAITVPASSLVRMAARTFGVVVAFGRIALTGGAIGLICAMRSACGSPVPFGGKTRLGPFDAAKAVLLPPHLIPDCFMIRRTPSAPILP